MSHYVCEHCGDMKRAALDICTDPGLRCKRVGSEEARSEARYPTSAELHEVVDGLRGVVRRCWGDILKFEREANE